MKLRPLILMRIVNPSLLLTKRQVWGQSIQFFSSVVAEVRSTEKNHIKVDLKIELIGDQKTIRGTPADEEALIDSIDLFSMPELIISTPKKDFWIPRIELYTCPIPFQVNGLDKDMFIVYEEYRTIEERDEGSEFTRWLTISYFDKVTTTMFTQNHHKD